MSEYHPDMDQIMALAAGHVPPEEAARLEAGLDADAKRELATQRAALAALGQLPRPTMSAGERSRLRAAIRDELNLAPIRSPAPPARILRSRRGWFARAVPSLVAAASLVAVIGIVLNLGGGSDEEAPLSDYEAAATTAAPTMAAPAPETTRAALATTATTEAAAEEAQAASDEATAAAAEAAEAMTAEALMEEEPAPATTTTAAAATTAPTTAAAAARKAELAAEEEAQAASDEATAAAAAEEAAARALRSTFIFSTDRPHQALQYTSTAYAGSGLDPFPVSQLPDLAAPAGLVCWENAADAADPDAEVYFMERGLIDGVDGEAYGIAVRSDSDEEEADLEEADPGTLYLFVYPDCSRVRFSLP